MSSMGCRTAMVAVLLVLGCACSGNESGPSIVGAGGSEPGKGGTNAVGGGVASGGATASGGSVSSGGVTANGGAVATGGVTSTGGTSTTSATGGRSATGGSSTSIGSTATGGTTSNAGGKAGATGKGGAATGGTAAIGGRSAGGAPTGGAAGAATGGQATAGSTGTGNDPTKSDGCGKTPTLKSGNGQTISVSGSNRTFNLKLPDTYDNSKPHKLMVAYHPLGGTADQVSGTGMGKPFYGLWDLAGGSTIFVAPQGLNNGWSNSGGADVEFSRQLITKIESDLCIDKSRIFCEGFSMGGSMSYAMACAMGDVVRAVAAHSGGPMSGCVKPHDKPVAYFMTHGTNDSVCTYPGYGVPELQDFAKTNGCTSPDPSLSKQAFADAMPDPTDSSGKTPVCVDFTGCKAGYPARACIFVGDHTPTPGGASSWVPAETWKFLSQF